MRVPGVRTHSSITEICWEGKILFTCIVPPPLTTLPPPSSREYLWAWLTFWIGCVCHSFSFSLETGKMWAKNVSLRTEAKSEAKTGAPQGSDGPGYAARFGIHSKRKKSEQKPFRSEPKKISRRNWRTLILDQSTLSHHISVFSYIGPKLLLLVPSLSSSIVGPSSEFIELDSCAKIRWTKDRKKETHVFIYKIHFSEVIRNNMSSVFTPLPSRKKSFSFSCSVLYPFYCQGTFSHLLPHFVSFFYICCLVGHGEQAEGEGEGRGQEQGEGEAAPHREH